MKFYKIAILVVLFGTQYSNAFQVRCIANNENGELTQEANGSWTLTCPNQAHQNVHGCCWCGGPARLFPNTLAGYGYLGPAAPGRPNAPRAHCSCVVHAQGTALPQKCDNAGPLRAP